MVIKKVKLIYFSPTGTTESVIESIAEEIPFQIVDHINLTLPEGVFHKQYHLSEELVILASPVYGGRLPVDAISRFKKLQGNKTLAILIVVYGNREFDDALLELKNLAIELGFIPVAGAAFIGEHSFATEMLPIANGRPDSLDLEMAKAFWAKIKEKIELLPSPDAQADLDLPGTFPYEASARSMLVSPVTNEETCTLCGTCARVCPTSAITIKENVVTETELCIRCSACIKNCPTEARIWEDSTMLTIATWLNENFSTRKEPQFFGVDM